MDSRPSPSVTTRAHKLWKSGVGVALASTVALLTLAGCGATSTGGATSGSGCPSASTQTSWNLVSPGKMTIITNSPYAPAEFPDPNDPTKVVGYDMDIANAIAKQMCLTLVVNNTENFDSIIPDISQPPLGQQRYDMSISSFTINSDRQKSVDMIPYFQAGQSLLLPPSSSAGLTSDLSTWCGKSIAVQDGTVELQQLQDINGGNNKTGENPICKSDPIKILHFADQSVVVLQVVNGGADASFQDSPVTGYYAEQNKGKVVLGPVPNDPNAALSPEGIVVRKDNAPFENAVKAALQTIRTNGTYASILAKWGETSGAYPPLS
ncbi:MAG TPA: ABC transporter substrate-binding protein [Ktedonobacterales bacterium]